MFLGEVHGDQLLHEYQSCDVFCAPSVGYESFGITLLEAMAAGLLVVATPVGGIADVTDRSIRFHDLSGDAVRVKDRVFFCNSGAEANEAALKLARFFFMASDSPALGFPAVFAPCSPNRIIFSPVVVHNCQRHPHYS